MQRVVTLILAVAFFAFVIQTREVDTQAVSTCPALIQDALARVEQLCAGTGRNQICYGNSVLLAEPRPEITDALLSMPGDITEIQNISRVQLFPMDVNLQQWGVALMRVQANLPDALPGQNVLFLLFGDTELLPELSPASTSVSSAMQSPINAFRLRTGVGAPQCDSAPPSGLIIQTPHGIGRVELTLNGVDLSLGSTVFFTAQENGYLSVSTLEGSAYVNAAGGESVAMAGSEVQVPLDSHLQPIAAPLLPQPYDAAQLSQLPLAALERPVDIHPPLTADELIAVQQSIGNHPANAAHSQAASGCPGNSCNTPANGGGQPANPPANNGGGGQGNGGNNPNGNGGNCPGNSCNAPGHGGSCPGNSCNSNGAAGNGGREDSEDG